MEEFLEHDALVELLHDAALFFQGQRVEEFAFHLGGEPVDLLLVADVFEFDADMTGIAFLQAFKDLAEGGRAQADEIAGKKVLIEVVFGKAKEGKVEVGAAVFPGADGVGRGEEVALVAVAQDEAVGAQFLLPVDAVGGGGGSSGAGRGGGRRGRSPFVVAVPLALVVVVPLAVAVPLGEPALPWVTANPNPSKKRLNSGSTVSGFFTKSW